MVPDHYSEKVAEAIVLIWKSYDKTAMRRGYDLLTEAAREGDADAYCFLGRCHLGEEYVGSGGGFVRDASPPDTLPRALSAAAPPECCVLCARAI